MRGGILRLDGRELRELLGLPSSVELRAIRHDPITYRYEVHLTGGELPVIQEGEMAPFLVPSFKRLGVLMTEEGDRPIYQWRFS
jgi:hypothetical protein